MKQITSIEELDEAIKLLEIKHSSEAMLLKGQLQVTYENMRPVNLLKNTLHDLVSSADFKDGVFSSILSKSAGYLSKKIVTGSTLNPIKLLSGNILQMIVTSLVSKNTDGIKRAAVQFITKIVSKKNAEA